MLSKIARAIADPGYAWYRMYAEAFPGALRNRYETLARSQGFSRPYFLLSFDCDTDLDIEVAESVHERLQKCGITPVYAVPGALLERGEKSYRALAGTGAEFINHGYRIHTELNAARREYVSTVFYDRLSMSEVVDDIQRGDRAIRQVLGKATVGFRSPHFGTYSRLKQLLELHEILSSLGYRFSSSSVPLMGLQKGPAPKFKSGLYELPVTGQYDNPLHALDSWSFRFDPLRRQTERDYIDQLRKLAEYFVDGGHAGFVNIYADPSQVYDWPDFFEAIRAFSSVAARSYDEVLGGITS
jgi:peptidoglycan/xylan/chitin deacetylase (PgdA/CDA1 family)